MSDWGKVESRYAREISVIKRLVYPYEYKDRKANETDKKTRDLWISKLRETKSILADIMGAAYREKDQSAEQLKKLIDDLDLAINEMRELNYWKFPDTENLLEKIVKSDLVLFNNIDSLLGTAKNLHSKVISAESTNMPIKLENFRKLLNDSRAVFLERAEIIKLKR